MAQSPGNRTDSSKTASAILGRRRISSTAAAICEAIESRTYLTVAFSSPGAVALSGAQGPLTTAQFDNSSPIDLAVGTTSGVEILLGNSVGTFDPTSSIAYPANSASQTPFVVGDFNGSRSDIVLLSQDSTTHNGIITYETSQLDGTFHAGSASTISNAAHGFAPIAGAVGDFNGDGNDDLAIIGKPTTGSALTLAILLSNGNGGFTESHDYSITGSSATGSTSAISISTADLGQGHTDVILHDSTGSNLDVFMGAGDGSLTQLTPVSTTASLMITAVTTTSGFPDVITASGSQLTVLLGNGNGTFNAQSPITAGGAVTSLSSADVDLDLSADLITNFGVATGNGDGTFDAPVALPAAEGGGLFATDIVAADVDGDGRPDLIGISSTTNSILTAKNITMVASAASVSSSENPANPGDDVQFTATVSSALNLNATGNVDFFDNTTLIGSAQLQDDSTATLDAGTALAIGPHSITAHYDGDSDFAASVSPIFNQTILAPTITAVASSENPSAAGDVVTFTATITGIDGDGDIPSGNVEFFDGSSDLGGAVVDSTGKATMDIATLPSGLHQITAQYQADFHYTASTSPALAQTVNETDLAPVVASTTLPASVIAGAPAHGFAIVDITNTTASTINSPVALTIFASSNGSVNGATSVIAVPAKDMSIAPGNTAVIKVPIKSLPSALGDGIYTLIAQVVYNNGLVSSAVTGPTIQITAPFVSLSESFPAIKLPTTVVAGASLKGSIKVTLGNHGNINATGSTTFSISVSSLEGQPGTTIPDIIHKTNIRPGGSQTITLPITTIPVVNAGTYFLVVQVTDPKGGVSAASPDTTVQIVAPVITLSAALGPVKNPSAGDTLTITNHGNIDDATALSPVLGFSTDAQGTQPAGTTTVAVLGTVRIKTGKTLKLHLNQWKSLLTGLTSGSYYLTVTLTDDAGNTAQAVTPDPFTI